MQGTQSLFRERLSSRVISGNYLQCDNGPMEQVEGTLEETSWQLDQIKTSTENFRERNSSSKWQKIECANRIQFQGTNVEILLTKLATCAKKRQIQ